MIQRILKFAGPVAVVFMMARVTWVAASPLSNGDTWFHLRLGHDLGAPWDWASVDHWSTFATSEWIPSQPVADLLMAGVDATFGLPGVAWLYGLGLLLFLLSCYGVARAWAVPLVAGLVTGLALVGAADSLSARPQLLSMILIPLVVHVWLRTEQDHRPRWWLIGLTWVWAMCHGFWLVGVGIGAFVAAGLILSGAVRGRRALELALVPLGSFLAAALTPLGPRLVLAPLTVNERAALITEWQRPDFLSPQPWPAILVVVVAGGILLARRQLTLPRGLLVVQAAGWLLLSIRTVNVAALIAVPLLAIALQSLIVRADDQPDRRRDVRALAVVATLLLAALALAVPQRADEAGKVPTALDGQISRLPSGSTVFNDSAIGGWLAYEHPELNVVVDGLFDAYPVAHLEGVRDAMMAEPGWEAFLGHTGAVSALIPERAPLAEELRELGWRDAGSDEGYVLLESPQLRR